MTNLREMNARREQWMNEQPQWGGGNELYLNEGDTVLFFFASNDGTDDFIKHYFSHAYEGRTKSGKPTDILRFCPIKNGETEIACPHCAAGNTKFKERMSMWLWVTNILHSQMPRDKQFPQIQYNNKYYFNEEVNDWRIWNTSAWRESPWNDIVKQSEYYKGLHNFTATIEVVGRDLTKRFKFYPIPNSAGLPPELYERAKAECQKITDRLRLEVNQPVAVNPQAQAAGQPMTTVGQIFQPIQPTPQVAPFSPPGQSIPALTLPSLSASPAPSEPTPTLSVPTLGTPSPVQQEEAKAEILAATEAGAPDEPPFETEPVESAADPTPPVATETARRPLKAMF